MLLRGRGQEGKGGSKSGDLYLKIKVRKPFPQKVYEKYGEHSKEGLEKINYLQRELINAEYLKQKHEKNRITLRAEMVLAFWFKPTLPIK